MVGAYVAYSEVKNKIVRRGFLDYMVQEMIENNIENRSATNQPKSKVSLARSIKEDLVHRHTESSLGLLNSKTEEDFLREKIQAVS